jgi:hypothetical protein
MTLAAGDRALRSNDPRRQCAGAKPRRGRKPERGFAEAEPPTGGEAYTACYVQLDLPYYVIKHIDRELRNAAWFYQMYDDGTLRKLSGAKAGNKVAAWRTEQRLNEIFEAVNWDKDKTLFITITHYYVKTEKGRQESWRYFQKELPKLIRKLKTKGMKDFIVVKEAHRDGGCHAHLLCQFEKQLKAFIYKGKRRLANKTLRTFIKDNWAGDVDIELMKDDDIKGYMKKYLGKYSHIEDALRRAKRGWAREGDLRHKDADCKKLWTNYYCGKLKMRRFVCSEKRRKKERPEGADLVKNMNKSTAENKPLIIKQWLIPWAVRTNPAFEPYNGKVDPESREYILAMREKEDT